MTEATPGPKQWFEAVREGRPEMTPQRAAARRVGQALRELIDQTVATSAPVEALEGVAEVLEALGRVVARYPQGRLYEGFAESGPSGDPYAFFDNSPIIGMANPLAPPIHMSVEEVEGEQVVIGTATYGGAYEGPPGCVHGGYVAAAFDEVLGMTQSIAGRPGMTGTLTIRYRRPTPLHAELRFEGRLDRVEGRKIFTVGESFADGELLCEAEAVFITVDFARIAALYADRG
jgi:acyl-coenzyme A thioesterase PaaI-like protein